MIKFRSLIKHKGNSSLYRSKICLKWTNCYALHENSLTLSWRGYQFGVGSSQLNPDSWYVSNGSITSPKKSLCPNVSWFHMVSHSERVNISSNPILNWKTNEKRTHLFSFLFFSFFKKTCASRHICLASLGNEGAAPYAKTIAKAARKLLQNTTCFICNKKELFFKLSS